MKKPEFDTEFEREVAQAMRPVAAPTGLADAILARALAEQPKAKVLAWPMPPRWVVGALAASLLLGAGLTGEHVHERRREQAEADRQFALAMQVTDHALNTARQQLSRAGVRLAD